MVLCFVFFGKLNMWHSAFAKLIFFGFYLCQLVLAQPGSQIFACCAANATISYGNCDRITNAESVSTSAELTSCWEKGKNHFRNNTLDPTIGNVTKASFYQMFMIVLSSKNKIIEPATNKYAVLSLSSEDIASNTDLQQPMLGLRIIFSFPTTDTTFQCQPLELRNWKVNISIDNEARTSNMKVSLGSDSYDAQPDAHNIWGLGLYFSGCSRDVSVLSNMSLSSLGYGQPSFSFLTIRGQSQMVATEASQDLEISGYRGFCVDISKYCLI